MALFWSQHNVKLADLPFKVQAESIRNNGKDPIYIYSLDDDVPVTRSMMLAYSVAVINPGCELDVTKNPYFNTVSPWSSPDQDICIHSDGDIDVAIISNDLCNRWTSDPKHPWNGAPYPNGMYTNKFKSQIGYTVVGNGGAGGAGNPTGIPAVGVGNLGKHVLPGFGHISKPPEWIEMNITIAGITKCTCGEKKLRNPGKCSHWCDLELDKNKQTM